MSAKLHTGTSFKNDPLYCERKLASIELMTSLHDLGSLNGDSILTVPKLHEFQLRSRPVVDSLGMAVLQSQQKLIQVLPGLLLRNARSLAQQGSQRSRRKVLHDKADIVLCRKEFLYTYYVGMLAALTVI